jgi:hypothetical protein
MQLKEGKKIAESQKKLRDDGEDVNERDEIELFCLKMRIRREWKACRSCMQSFLKVSKEKARGKILKNGSSRRRRRRRRWRRVMMMQNNFFVVLSFSLS